MKIAILSDIHANIFAFEAVLKIINDEKVEKIIVAGDLIGYYYWPHEIIKICMDDDRFFCIKGNHEENLKKILKDKSKLNFYQKKYGSSYKFCLKLLTSNQIEWLINLPKKLSLKIKNTTFYISHGSINTIDKYIYPTSSKTILKKNFSSSKFTILGHTHYPFVCNFKNKFLINPGSVGQPRDIGNLASFFIIDLDSNVIIPKRISFSTKKIIEYVNTYDYNIPYLKNILKRK